MQISKIITLKIYLFLLIWFGFYNFLPPLLLEEFQNKTALLYSVLSVVFFSLSYFIFFNLKKSKYNTSIYKFELYQFHYIFLILFFLSIAGGGLFHAMFPIISAIYSIKLIENRKYFLLLIIFSLTVSYLVVGYTRMFLLMYFLYIFMYFYFQNKKLYFLRILILSFVSLIILVVMLFMRQGEFEGLSSVFSIVQEAGNASLLRLIDTYYIYEAYLFVINNFPNNYDFIYGESLIKPFLFWIPREIWETKPENLTLIISQYMLGETRAGGISTGMTITGEFFLNFGIYGVAFFSYLLGTISAFFAHKFITSEKEYIKYIALIYFVLFPSLLRGGIATTVLFIIIFSTIIFIMYRSRKIFKRIRMHKKTKKLDFHENNY